MPIISGIMNSMDRICGQIVRYPSKHVKSTIIIILVSIILILVLRDIPIANNTGQVRHEGTVRHIPLQRSSWVYQEDTKRSISDRKTHGIYMKHDATIKSVEQPFGLYEEQIDSEFDAITWLEMFNVEQFKKSVNKTLQQFAPSMPLQPRGQYRYRETYRNLTILWNMFASMCESNNITYFLYSGSMIGAYRHHGLVPWDDDIDVLVNITQSTALHEVLEAVPDHLLDTSGQGSWVFYHIPEYRGKPPADIELWWPFIEILFFAENETHIWDDTALWGTSFYQKFDVLPLQRRPFLGNLWPVPCNMHRLMEQSFSLEYCESPHTYHVVKIQTRLKPTTTLCSNLYQYFPFVEHINNGTSHIELLKLNGTVVSCIQTEPFCY